MQTFTKEPWFGKKTIGLGVKPITWQGWIITLILAAFGILSVVHFRRSLTAISIVIFLIVIYVVVALLTGIKTDFTLKDRKS